MMKNKREIKNTIIIYLGVTFMALPLWINKSFGHLDFEQLLFLVVSDGQGTAIDWMQVLNFILFFLPIWVITTMVIYYIKKNNITFNLKSKAIKLLSLVIVFCMIFAYDYQFKIFSFFINGSTESDLYERYYVDPTDTALTFPNQKQNLIYIVLESMETGFSEIVIDEEVVNLIPNLEYLAQNYTSFSNSNALGGGRQLKGTTWTAASLSAQTSGIPIQMTNIESGYNEKNGYLPGVFTLGEVLVSQGYKNYFLAGSDANFGSRETYFKSHGNYEILDIKHYKEIGVLEEDYNVFWGFEDAKLFEYAKHELLEISTQDEPFNFTMLTVDTHFLEGYTDLSCDFYYDSAYANAIHCSDNKVYDFIKWIQAQDFYKNTTIVLTGDHHTMNHDFALNMVGVEDRSIYNVFINAQFKNEALEYTKNREFSVLDMFPTTLAALGVDIDGNQLGLGINLMSGKETLIEKLSQEVLEAEFSKHSEYYNTNFLNESLAE